MSDTLQIIGIGLMMLFMLIAGLYAYGQKIKWLRALWCMMTALILGVILF
ncbi:hypothetical protein P0092_09260 [Ruminiclostridium papyrosolvens DSM 2782]|nr:hypothetical protein [Ruminiclostridium papyrosolvens]WES36036.1 hypothetical protein P0092_08760 [Ruminiclostridium papyrosolvens DSM 2782]WES36134.1 hypothetical protein P0092_09260 [Ruminiclostridium papyrosolvens DSM 2782]